jgi:hypothetical protein
MDEASRQLPPLQTWPGAQAEQPPQWSASLLLGTAQAVPQSVSPSEQAALHALLLHTWPDGQAVVQSPQWVASGGTQAPLQSIPDTHWHAPPWQIWPAEQGMPQPPQFFASAVTGMHC